MDRTKAASLNGRPVNITLDGGAVQACEARASRTPGRPGKPSDQGNAADRKFKTALLFLQHEVTRLKQLPDGESKEAQLRCVKLQERALLQRQFGGPLHV